MQYLIERWDIGYLNLIAGSLVSFKELFWYIIYIIAIVGAYFWYIDKKHRSRYLFEMPSKLEFIYDLLTKGLSGFAEAIKMLKFTINLAILLILFGVIAYIILGKNSVPIIIFLSIISWLKMVVMYQESLKKEGIKNSNYIATVTILNSLKIFFISLIETIFSIKILYSLAYLLITAGIFLIKVELFYLWAVIWLLIYAHKFISCSYEIKLLQKPPLFVTIAYLSGDIDSNLILYQTTATDYRFKNKSSGDELIIPTSSIKKIYYDYDSELSDLDYSINFKIKPLKIRGIMHRWETMINNYVNVVVENFLIPIKPRLLYRKAVIYCKKNDFENAKICLGESINANRDFKEIAKEDRDFNNIQNEQWFKHLIYEQGINEGDSDA
ncbi:MAG: hypothetical protein Q8M95_14585 [Candidatus Methanoperedens sp.]|nr:hypothetical protein [Candidatus Methanoperedens sp.]